MERLNHVLAKHGIREGAFTEDRKALQYSMRDIVHAGETYRIEVSEGQVVMQAMKSGRLYELDTQEEFASPSAQIEGFAARLDRFLGGGPWEGPDEDNTPFDRLIGAVRRLFGR